MKLALKKALLTSAAIITVSAFGAQAQAATWGLLAITSQSLTGPIAGSNDGAVGANTVGNGGTEGLRYGAPGIIVTAPSGDTITGGDGTAGGVDAANTGGSNGGGLGEGVNFNYENGTALTTGNYTGLVNNSVITGGNGGAGSASGTATSGTVSGGIGGIGGFGIVDDANFSEISGTGTITGGNGGAGGNGGTAGDTGGAGGIGGWGIYISSNNTQLNSMGAIVGGIGGIGGNGDTGGAAGAGGNGGKGIGIDGNSATLTINNNVNGGNGGTGGTGGAGGSGGDAVKVAGTNAVINDTGTLIGGNGGAGAGNDDLGGSGGTGGGGAGIYISEIGDSATVNVAGGNVTGGNGGDGGTGGLGGSGILTKGANTLITIAASATVTGGLDGSGSGTNGLNEGVYLLGTDAILTNHGTIIGGANNNGDAIGVGRNTTSITNDGHLTAIGGAGVLVTDLSNTGTTDATLALLDNTNGHIDITNGVGVLVEPVSGTATSVSSITTLNNTAGSIATTGGFGVFIGCSSACDTTVPLRATIGNIINTGIISATTGDALYVQASGALTALHNTGGTITSANVGDFFGFAGATVVFDSTVQTAIHLNGTISNTAANNAAEALAIVATPAGTITNDGTIQSNGTGAALGVAVDLRAAATFDNASGGVVTGQVIDTGDVATTLTNEGHITGVVTIDGNALHTFTNTGALTGAVTIGGNTTNTINITGGSLSSTLTGGSGVDNLTLANGAIGGNTDLGAGANTMLVNGTFTTGGTFAATGGTIALTVASGGTLTVENTITTGAAALNVANGGILNVDGANLLNGGAFTNGGTTRIGAGRSLTAASYVAASAGTLTIGLTGDGVTNTAGLLQASTGASVINLSNTTLHIDVSGAGAIATGAGAAVAIARGGAGATELAADEPLAITDNSFFYDFSVAPGAGGAATDLLLTATAASIAGVVTDTNNVDVATVLLTGPLATSTDPQINAIQDKLAGDTTQAQFNADLQATEPTVDGGNIIAAVGATDASFDTVGEQLTALRTGDETGMSAGDQAHGLRGWIQGFGQHANQNERGGSPGYDANTWGGAIGFDSQGALENAVLGVSFGYGRTNADSKNSNSTNTDVDSYQLTLYGEQHVNKGMFVDGMASFGWDRNSETRHDIGGVTGLDAHADFNAWQGAARAEVGDDYNVTGGMTLTPTASVDYLHYDAQTFSETGAGGSDLVGVNFGNVDMLNLGVGVKAAWLFKNSDGSQVKPDVHAGYKYDVLSNDHVDATASFAAGGGTFTTNGLNPSNSTFDAGADIIFFSTSNWELKGSYDFTWKQDYTANSGHIRATYKF